MIVFEAQIQIESHGWSVAGFEEWHSCGLFFDKGIAENVAEKNFKMCSDAMNWRVVEKEVK
jgi:hypothetical protein